MKTPSLSCLLAALLLGGLLVASDGHAQQKGTLQSMGASWYDTLPRGHWAREAPYRAQLERLVAPMERELTGQGGRADTPAMQVLFRAPHGFRQLAVAEGNDVPARYACRGGAAAEACLLIPVSGHMGPDWTERFARNDQHKLYLAKAELFSTRQNYGLTGPLSMARVSGAQSLDPGVNADGRLVTPVALTLKLPAGTSLLYFESVDRTNGMKGAWDGYAGGRTILFDRE